MKTENKLNMTMLCDFYELTMGNGYFQAGYKDRITYFDVFFRDVPDRGGFAICAGLEQLIDYILDLHFDDEDIEYLRSKNLFDEQFLEYLHNFKFTGDIWAIPEGTPIFPREPVVVVRAPAIQAQLIETFTLLSINHQSLIATKANRIVRAAKGRTVLEFGSRRAQGIHGAIAGARAAYIGGCGGTACTISDELYGVPASGTMAHAWVQMFDDELTAFRNYCKLYPHNATLLVDTYNVLESGVPHAIQVFKEMREAGIPLTKYGIRLDSGDLAYLSKKARKMLDEAGFHDAVIAASSDLDENLINSLKNQGAEIHSWGVGTNLITSSDCPAFGGVYKLAAIIDNATGQYVPKIKLSENTAKVTNPGDKTVFRIYDIENGKMIADLIALAHEEYDSSKPLLIFDPIDTWKKTYLAPNSYTIRKLPVQVFKDGKCVYDSPSVMEIRAYCQQEKDTLWEEGKRLTNPHRAHIDLSNELFQMKAQLLDSMSTSRIK